LQCSEAHEKQELCILLLNRRAVDYPVYVYAYQKPEGLIETLSTCPCKEFSDD